MAILHVYHSSKQKALTHDTRTFWQPELGCADVEPNAVTAWSKPAQIVAACAFAHLMVRLVLLRGNL